MSKYTTEVRYICETAYGLTESKGADSVDTIIEGCLDKVFNFSFPIFDESYRRILESKILKHYYTREIAHETVGLWKLKLNTKLNEIMPYYNKLYRSELLEFNPLYTKNITRDHTTKVDSTTDSTSHNDTTSMSHASGTNGNTNWDLYSDTPQGTLTNIEDEKYLTSARKTTDSGSSSSDGYGASSSDGRDNSSANSTEDYLEHVVGFEGGNASKLLMDYRDTFLNIDMLIIGELEELFFQLW